MQTEIIRDENKISRRKAKPQESPLPDRKREGPQTWQSDFFFWLFEYLFIPKIRRKIVAGYSALTYLDSHYHMRREKGGNGLIKALTEQVMKISGLDKNSATLIMKTLRNLGVIDYGRLTGEKNKVIGSYLNMKAWPSNEYSPGLEYYKKRLPLIPEKFLNDSVHIIESHRMELDMPTNYIILKEELHNPSKEGIKKSKDFLLGPSVPGRNSIQRNFPDCCDRISSHWNKKDGLVKHSLTKKNGSENKIGILANDRILQALKGTLLPGSNIKFSEEQIRGYTVFS